MLQGVREFRHIGCWYWTSSAVQYGPVKTQISGCVELMVYI